MWDPFHYRDLVFRPVDTGEVICEVIKRSTKSLRSSRSLDRILPGTQEF